MSVSAVFEKLVCFMTERFYRALYEERFRLFNFIPVLFGIGIIYYFSLMNEPEIWPYGLGFLLFVGGFFMKNYPKIRWISCVLAIVTAGFIAAFIRTHFIGITMLNEKISYINLVGIVDYCEKSYNGTKIVLENVECASPELLEKFNKVKWGKISLIWRGERSKNCQLNFSPGSKIAVKAILDPIRPKRFRNAYDFRMQSYFNGVSARGYILYPPTILGNSDAISKLKDKVRFLINNKIHKVTDRAEGGIAQALITGNKFVIDKKVRASFSDSGMAHILAISGLHVSVIGGFFFLIFRFLFSLFSSVYSAISSKKVAAILSLVAVFFYLKISGESVPAVRAFMMHIMVTAAILCDRTAFSMRSVALAALGIMIVTPEVILFPSFQMSFSAVIALVAFYEKSWRLNRGYVFVLTLLCTSIIASLATSIFTVYVFNRVTLASVFANLLAVPLTTIFIMPMAVISVLSMPFGLEILSINLLEFGISLLIIISNFFANQKWMISAVCTPDVMNLGFVVSGFLVLALLGSRLRLFGIPIAGLGLVLFWFQKLPIAVSANFGDVVGFRLGDNICFCDLVADRGLKNDICKTLGCEMKRKLSKRDGIRRVSERQYLVRGKVVDFGKNMSCEVFDDGTCCTYEPPRRIWGVWNMKN